MERFDGSRKETEGVLEGVSSYEDLNAPTLAQGKEKFNEAARHTRWEKGFPGEHGSVLRWKAEKGFGFVRLHDGREAFCHVDDLCKHLQPPRGQGVPARTEITVGKVTERPKGLAAKNVMCNECAELEVWELQPSGPEIFGVRELKPVCVNKEVPSYAEPPIPFSVTWDANESFRQAKKKVELWKRGDLGGEFFKAFGEPQEVRALNENKIVLVYPDGEKEIYADTALHSGHWEVAPSGSWKEGEYGRIQAEFTFPDISGARSWQTVATLTYDGKAQLSKEFDTLDPHTQQEILLKFKESMPSPERVAEKRFENFLHNEATAKRLSKLRTDIRALQAPGDKYVSMRTYNTTLHEPTSSDGMRGGYDYAGTIIQYFLVTGARKTDIPRAFVGEYEGGDKVLIVEGEYPQEPAGSPDAIAAQLLEKRREIMKIEFERRKDVALPDHDSRLYDFDVDEWKRRYNARWDELQRALEQEWEREETEQLARAREAWESYKHAAQELRDARKEAKAVEERAKAAWMWDKPDTPFRENIGAVTVDQMIQETEGLRAYVAEMERRIAEKLAAQEEAKRREEEERVARKAAALAAEERAAAQRREQEAHNARYREILAHGTSTDEKQAQGSDALGVRESVQGPAEVAFSPEKDRHFKCSHCAAMQRLTKGEYKRYTEGASIALTCTHCGGKGEVRL